jgi:hypothetical protein
MKRIGFHLGLVALLVLLFTGCASPPYNYTNFRAHPPRSILVLPPLNETTAVQGTYSYLSTITLPLAEKGYYVFPVAVIDHFFKENGMPTAGEMHQASMQKIREIFGADAVLYITLKQYGSKYQVLNSATRVMAYAKLVDAATETVLWEGTVSAEENSPSTGNILGDLMAAPLMQAINQTSDEAHAVARTANAQFAIKDHGLLYGPYHPKYGTD